MVTYNFPPIAVDTTGIATSANQVLEIAELVDINTELNTQTVELVDINTELNTQTVELLAINTELNTQTTELQSINTELDTQTTALNDINTELNTQTTELQSINTELNSQTVELQDINTSLDAILANTDNLAVFQVSALIDASSTNIPGSASLPLTLIASTSAQTREIQIVEDIGEYMALYIGAAAAEVLLCALPLGGGEVKVNVPAATRISIKALKTPAITSSNLIINLLG